MRDLIGTLKYFLMSGIPLTLMGLGTMADEMYRADHLHHIDDTSFGLNDCDGDVNIMFIRPFGIFNAIFLLVKLLLVNVAVFIIAPPLVSVFSSAKPKVKLFISRWIDSSDRSIQRKIESLATSKSENLYVDRLVFLKAQRQLPGMQVMFSETGSVL